MGEPAEGRPITIQVAHALRTTKSATIPVKASLRSPATMWAAPLTSTVSAWGTRVGHVAAELLDGVFAHHVG